MDTKKILINSFKAGLDAVKPENIIKTRLPSPPKGRTYVIGAGKAAASMAKAIEVNWPKNLPLNGSVITRYKHSVKTKRIKVFESGHPMPDTAGMKAANNFISSINNLNKDDLLLCLISGGGSSLMSVPQKGLNMNDLRYVTKDLLNCGAEISEINTVRKHLSRIHGGKIPIYTNAKIISLIISDVTGNKITDIASGPCCPDPTTFKNAIKILEKYEIKNKKIYEFLKNGIKGKINENPKKNNPIFKNVKNIILASGKDMLKKSELFLKKNKITTVNLGDNIKGESRNVAIKHAEKILKKNKKKFAIISGGETTVTVSGSGKGGRNSEYALSLFNKVKNREDIALISCDTDGIDGSENNAGVYFDKKIIKKSKQLKLDPELFLKKNDSYTFFKKLNSLINTGPTLTNVNDYRVILKI
ncbi:MAG: putative hydroxypyruvate reductase [Alphaproteobacteria bacterium MarineAlpha6_Bin6]|nr:MAG: putative hydroxypyruvate reductase [Alphaproteobacteria bacterium MarineAlpha6_Bin6]PPR33396.1 MAG: putative hydroxypyruvate reductase [Alphaproteobacteria bacterium MarineAlpha6_Bin5]|tara:strand:- start:9446 stop:10696 length:1251 start_codon:yes stop_codon:yes gene_type:complete